MQYPNAQRVNLFSALKIFRGATFTPSDFRLGTPTMQTSNDEREDEMGLLDDKWLRKQEHGGRVSWRLWGTGILCLVAGFALGALFHRISTSTPQMSHGHGKSLVAPFGKLQLCSLLLPRRSDVRLTMFRTERQGDVPA